LVRSVPTCPARAGETKSAARDNLQSHHRRPGVVSVFGPSFLKTPISENSNFADVTRGIWGRSVGPSRQPLTPPPMRRLRGSRLRVASGAWVIRRVPSGPNGTACTTPSGCSGRADGQGDRGRVRCDALPALQSPGQRLGSRGRSDWLAGMRGEHASTPYRSRVGRVNRGVRHTHGYVARVDANRLADGLVHVWASAPPCMPGAGRGEFGLGECADAGSARILQGRCKGLARVSVPTFTRVTTVSSNLKLLHGWSPWGREIDPCK
jgi:hypothetical protein